MSKQTRNQRRRAAREQHARDARFTIDLIAAARLIVQADNRGTLTPNAVRLALREVLHSALPDDPLTDPRTHLDAYTLIPTTTRLLAVMEEERQTSIRRALQEHHARHNTQSNHHTQNHP